jgi:hypothetical protein
MSDDKLLTCLRIGLRHWTPIFCIFSRDGNLQMRGVQFLQNGYSDQFRIVSASSVPTAEELNSTIFSTELTTREIERSYQGLLRFLGFKSWPWILIISNTESLSADQALALRGCLNERESDEPSDWPRSIIFVSKQGEFLPDDLHTFVHGVIVPDYD